MQVRENQVLVPESEQSEAAAGEETRRQRQDGLPGQHWGTGVEEKMGNKHRL
jgi:hypothetical protein